MPPGSPNGVTLAQSDPPTIRIWSTDRELYRAAFRVMDRVWYPIHRIIEILEKLGVQEIVFLPALQRVSRGLASDYELELFISGWAAWHTPDPETVRQEIQDKIGLRTRLSTLKTAAALQKRIKQHGLYQRQIFPEWNGDLPCFILGVDFDRSGNQRLRPAQPGGWWLVDHQVDGFNCARSILPALILEPTAKGSALLADLSERFMSWFGGCGTRGSISLDSIGEYRNCLKSFGVDCNFAFRDGLLEGWYPIDLDDNTGDLKYIRDLCATPLPDNLGDLLVSEDGGAVEWYDAHFQFVALTLNSD